MQAAKTVIAKRYSEALFAAAHAVGALNEVSSDLNVLRGIFDKNPKYMKFIMPKSSPSSVKSMFLNTMLASVDLHQITNNFLRLLVKHNRIYAIGEIKDAFFQDLETHNGELRVFVTSATDLKKDRHEKLLKDLESILGKRIILSFIVDKSMLGGMIIRVGSKMLDATIKNKLLRIRKLALQS